MNERVEYWISLSEYDLKTAKAMLKSKRFLYVGFMCHQTIEKALKAVISKDLADGEIPPKVHNLLKLASDALLFESMSESQQNLLYELNPLNIDARYPEYKDEITLGLNKKNC